MRGARNPNGGWCAHVWSWLRLRVLGDPGHPLVLGPAEARSFSNAAEVSRKRTGDDSFHFGILVDARMESAEAARRRSSAAASAACVESAATAAGAFDASGLTVYLKDVVTLCLENRPSDPVAFIAEYLRRVTHRTTPVSRACQYLRLVLERLSHQLRTQRPRQHSILRMVAQRSQGGHRRSVGVILA